MSATLPPGGNVAPDYSDPASWMCSPSGTDCSDNGDRVIVGADGSLDQVQGLMVEPEIDCFYVYPTISMDQSINSDLAPHDEEIWVMRNQAAPLSPACRVVAPIYRQVTIPGLGAMVGGADMDDAFAMAYGDVRAAWQHYLEHDNGGRGVILVGHSQGASHLNRLIREEIDPVPTVRDLLVAVYLAGSAVQVPVGEDVGGDFENVPLCRAPDQIGCVVTWASFRATDPPPEDSLFGSGGEGTEAGCNNPAALAGGPAELQAYFPAHHGATILSPGGTVEPWADPAVVDIETCRVRLGRGPRSAQRGVRQRRGFQLPRGHVQCRCLRPAGRRHPRQHHAAVGPPPRRHEPRHGRPRRAGQLPGRGLAGCPLTAPRH